MLQHSMFLEGLGKGRVRKIIELRNNQSDERPFTLQNIAIETSIPLQKWEAWEADGLIVPPGVSLRDILLRSHMLTRELKQTRDERRQLEIDNANMRSEQSETVAEKLQQMQTTLLAAIQAETRERELSNQVLQNQISGLARTGYYPYPDTMGRGPPTHGGPFEIKPTSDPQSSMHGGPSKSVPSYNTQGFDHGCPPSSSERDSEPARPSATHGLKKGDPLVHPALRAIPPDCIVSRPQSSKEDDDSKFPTQNFLLKNNVVVRVEHGDLLKQNTDAIAVPADSKLTNSRGIARKIKQIVGVQQFQDASDALLEAMGTPSVGDAISQGVIRLPCEHVIHSIVPTWREDDQTKYELQLCFSNVITYAMKHLKARSLTIPMLSLGGVPSEYMAHALCRTLKRFGETQQSTLLQEILIVDFSRPYLEQVAEICADIFPQAPATSANNNNDTLLPPEHFSSFKPRPAESTPNAPNISTPIKSHKTSEDDMSRWDRGQSIVGSRDKRRINKSSRLETRERKRDKRRERRARRHSSSESSSSDSSDSDSSESTDSDSPSYLDKAKSRRGHRHHHSRSSRRYRRDRHSRRDSNDSESSSLSSSSQSDLDDWRLSKSKSIRSRHSHSHHRRHRGRSPQMPKMATYDGDSTWNAFLFQFKRTARRYGWSKTTKLDRLMMCLRGKAVDFVKTRPKRVTTNYKRLVKHMTKRFGRHDPPITARRQLYSAKQKEDESLEEFADRIMELSVDALKGAKESLVQSIVADVFLKGIKDKAAASVAMDKDPPTIRKAVEYVRQAIHNRQALMGGQTPPRSYATRQMTREYDSQEEYAVRAVAKPGVSGNLKHTSEPSTSDRKTVSFSAELPKEHLRSLEAQMAEIGKLIKQSFPNNKASPTRSREEVASPQRGSSGSPSNVKCFNCQQLGHYSRSCPKRTRSPTGSPYRPSSTPPGTPPPRRNLNM